jgi:hypothetical protein
VLSHEVRQRMNRGQPLVASGNRTLPRLLQIGQEEPHQIRRYIDHHQSVHRLVQFVGNERNQQSEGIAVTALRVAGQIAFGYQMFEQKTPHPGPRRVLSFMLVPLGIALKALAGLVQQLRCQGKVTLCSSDMNMAEISCQLWQQALHVCPLPIPGDQAMNGAGVAAMPA